MSESEKKDKPCAACAINAGVGIALRIAEDAKIDVEDLKSQLFDTKITVQQFVDGVKSRLQNDEFHIGLLNEVEQVMKDEVDRAETVEQQEQPEPTGECVSIIVKERMGKQIDSMIQERETIQQSLPDPESPFGQGNLEIIENLRRSRAAIDKLPACEETVS